MAKVYGIPALAAALQHAVGNAQHVRRAWRGFLGQVRTSILTGVREKNDWKRAQYVISIHICWKIRCWKVFIGVDWELSLQDIAGFWR